MTAIRRDEVLARAAALDYPSAACNGIGMSGAAAWHARIGQAFELELAAVAAQLDVLEAAAALRHREVEPGTAEVLRGGAPLQSAEEFREVIIERERRTAHANAERARRLYELQTKQLEGIE